MPPFDGKWYRWDQLPEGPATTERIRSFFNWLTEEEIQSGEYQYSESPGGFGWNRQKTKETAYTIDGGPDGRIRVWFLNEQNMTVERFFNSVEAAQAWIDFMQSFDTN